MRSKEERIEMGKAAQAELDRLMESHPGAREAQKEIRDRLMRAGTPENRMGVLGIMIEGKLSDLQQQLSALASMASGETSRPTSTD